MSNLYHFEYKSLIKSVINLTLKSLLKRQTLWILALSRDLRGFQALPFPLKVSKCLVISYLLPSFLLHTIISIVLTPRLPHALIPRTINTGSNYIFHGFALLHSADVVIG